MSSFHTYERFLEESARERLREEHPDPDHEPTQEEVDDLLQREAEEAHYRKENP